MLTMAETARVVTDWVGDPGAVEEYSVRFSKPVVVPDDEHGADLVVSGEVSEMLDDSRVVVTITARVQGEKVLTAARAIVRLA
jgi:acyl dehydratase